ncbi:bacteriocin, partial [Salmonella enterica subsp. enterica serovar Typhi]|nr:bacteriocin [Salmonella enterica subsp. enterica serovar Typhi]
NEMLDRIEGGIFGVDDAVFWTVGGYVVGRIVDTAIGDFTNQCRKNPHQWFCVRV